MAPLIFRHRFELRQSGAIIRSGFLGSNGCTTVNIPDLDTTVTVYTRAKVNGITLEARRIDAFLSSCHPNGVMDSASWTVPAGVASSYQAVGPDDTWRNLAVASWAMHRNPLGIDQDVPRPCCLAGQGYQPDGLCSSGLTNYQRQTGKVFLYSVWKNGQFGDYMPACSSGAPPSYKGRALQIAKNTAIRTIIAHELGHLVTSIRMGGADQWELIADLDGCMGDYTGAAGGGPADRPPIEDLDPPEEEVKQRGEFTKEYLAAAIREGYADFYAAWLFNSRQQADGMLDMWTFHDFNLDCTIDNSANGFIPLNGPWGPPGAGDGINWLDDLQGPGDDSRSVNNNYGCPGGTLPVSCETTSPSTDHNRSTIIDLARMFWNLNQVPSSVGANLSPRQVTDLYLGSCPRQWDHLMPAINDVDHPFERLRDSAADQGILTEFNAYSNRIRP